MRSLLCLLAATAACGSVNKAKPDAAPPVPDAPPDAADPLDGAKSGTRLKLQWFVYGDGTKQLSGFHDSMLGADCSPSTMYGDTKMYCLPEATQVFYADAACTTKIAVQYTPCNNQQYQFAVTYQSMNCTSGVSHVYHLGAATTATTYYYKDSTNACGVYSTAGTDQVVNFIGAEVMPSEMVEVTKSQPAPGALGTVSLQTADGLSYPYTLHDTAGGYDCSPFYAYYGQTSLQCVPSIDYAGYFAESTCATNTVDRQTGCPAPAYAYVPPRSGCALDPYTFHSVGAALTPQPTTAVFYLDNTQACTSTSISSGYTWYGLGAALSPAMLTRAHDTFPGHRLQPNQFTSGSTRIRDYTVYDATLDADCYPERMLDGTWRCFPQSGYFQSSYFYSDPSCNQPINVVEIGRGPAGCAASPVPKYAQQSIQQGQCYGYDLHQVGAKYTAQLYYQNGTCVAYPSASSDFYVVGPQVPLVGLAAATQQNDP
jgi:hypothetical protein